MFTTKTMKALHFLLRLCTASNLLPYGWNPALEQFVRTKNWFRRFLNIFNLLFLLISTVAVTVSLFSGLSQGTDLVRISIDALFAFGFGFVLGNHIVFYTKSAEIVDFFHKFMEFNKKCTHHVYRQTHPLKKDNCHEILVLMSISECYFPFAGLFLFLLDPKSPRFSYYLIPEERTSVYTLTFWGLLQFYTYWLLCSATYLCIVPIFMYTMCTNFWLKKILQSEDSMTARDCRSIYSSTRVLNAMSNKCFSEGTWPCLFIMGICLISYGLVGTLTMYGNVPLYIYMIFPALGITCFGTYFLIFQLVGQVQERSSIYVKACRSRVGNSSKQDKLAATALRSFGANISSVFVVKKTTALQVILAVSNVTINALLLH